MGKLKTGDVVLSFHRTVKGTWWLVDGDPEVGVNSTLIHGEPPPGFGTKARTHWSDGVMWDQGAFTPSPIEWPEEVCAAVAKWRLTQC
jgi:hypothetical protein